jgi:hypothetical protein
VNIFVHIAESLSLFIFGLQLLATRAAFGHLFLASTATMIRVTLRGRKIILLVAGLSGLITASLQSQISWIPPFPPLLLTGFSLLALNGACLPPAVLYLGVSRRDGWVLTKPLQRTVAPLKFIHLLDSSLEINPSTRREVRRSEFRVWRKADWQHIVRQLSGIAPIVIVDARNKTASLEHEIKQIIRSGFDGRTFFLSDPIGRCKALSGVEIPSTVRLHVTTPDRMIHSLRRIGWLCILHDSVVPASIVVQRLDEDIWSNEKQFAGWRQP